MKFKAIRLCVLFTLCVVTLCFTNNVSAQNRRNMPTQSRGGEPAMSEENKRAMSEIKMLQETLNERRAQEDKQRQVLQELREAVDAVSRGRQQPQQVRQQNNPVQSSYSTQQQRRVTSGSTLSKIEAAEREEIQALEKKFSMEMQVAKREIDLLKKQLEIANRQIDRYAATSSSNIGQSAASFSESHRPATMSPQQKSQPQRRQAAVQPQKVQNKKQSKSQPKPRDNRREMRPTQAPAQSGGPIDLPPDIKQLQEQLKRRQEMQAEQMKLIKELQQQAATMK